MTETNDVYFINPEDRDILDCDFLRLCLERIHEFQQKQLKMNDALIKRIEGLEDYIRREVPMTTRSWVK